MIHTESYKYVLQYSYYKIAREFRIAWEIQISHAFESDYEL